MSQLIFDGLHPGNELYRYQIKKALAFLHEIGEIQGDYVMSRMLDYKGYHASIDYDDEDELFVGSVFGIRDSLNFHGTSVAE